MPLLSMDQAGLAKLRQLMAAVPDPPALGQRSNRTANARVPVLVRCTSATAAGGTETGHDQCYPAKVLNVNSLVANQAEEALVWLTLLDGGSTASPVTVAVPVAGNAYYGVFSGSFDPFPAGASDPRPRVFVIKRDTSSAFTPTFATSELGSGSHYSITGVAPTWSDSGLSISLPAAGTYLLFAQASGGVRLSAGGPEHSAIRLWNVTDAAVVAYTTAIVAMSDTTNVDGAGSASVFTPITVAASKTIRMEATVTNNNSSTWSAATLMNRSLSTSNPGSTVIGYVRIA